MFCSRCGTEVQVSSRFCPTCGLDLTTLTQGVGATGPTQAMPQPQQPDEADMVRQALKDEYELEKELGRGGMAIVFKARDKALEREVAIKVLPFSLSFDAEFVERFQREARTAGKLEHPNIIPIYRVGKSGRVIYFVMKFIRGKSLSGVIVTRGALPVPEAKRMLIECARALGYAHKHGIVHRDIKPDNIMFDELGQAIVTDFGIAKAQSGAKLTGTGMSIGTPHYMSPEQARAQNLDGRSDVYSLGVVAYQCLTGHVPFDGEDSFSIGYKHIMEELPTPPLETAEQRELFTIVQKMMGKKAEDRFQTAEDLVAALEGTGGVAAAMSMADVATMPTKAMPSVSPPAISTAATTPLPRASASMGKPADVAAVRAPSGAPRVVRKKSRTPVIVGASLGVIALGLGGYLALGRGGPAPPSTTSDTTGRSRPGIQTLARAETTTSPVAPPSRPDTAGARTPATPPGPTRPTPARPDTARPVSTPPVAGEGTLSLAGTIPPDARITIDGNAMRSTRQKLRVGPHTLRVTANGFEAYQARVQIALNATLTHTVRLQPAGATPPPVATAPPTTTTAPPEGPNCAAPSTAVRNPNNACYDTRPNPRGTLAVPAPEACTGRVNPATILVQVSATGDVIGTPQATGRSGCPQFDQAAAAYAADLSFVPATKGGTAVVTWTQVLIRPLPR